MIYNKIQAFCRKNNTNFAQLEKALGFGKGTMQKWNKSNPGIDKVQAVADHFGVSVDELLERGVFKHSEESQKIAAQFEELNEEKRNLVKCYLEVIKASA